jgi:tRNA 2-thiouridine synthesizing protein A
VVEQLIDAIGEMCPIPIIKAEKVLKKLNPNDRVLLKTDHSCSIASVTKHFKDKYGYHCVIDEVDEGIWLITIEKSC